MSGYAGIVRIGAAGEATAHDARRAEKMAAAIAFRGPMRAKFGITQMFTSVFPAETGPAPQAAVQPCSLDGRVWLLGDVR